MRKWLKAPRGSPPSDGSTGIRAVGTMRRNSISHSWIEKPDIIHFRTHVDSDHAKFHAYSPDHTVFHVKNEHVVPVAMGKVRSMTRADILHLKRFRDSLNKLSQDEEHVRDRINSLNLLEWEQWQGLNERVTFILDLVLPLDVAEDCALTLEDVCERRWVPQYGRGRAQVLCWAHATGMVVRHHGARIVKLLGTVLGLFGLKRLLNTWLFGGG
jgi:hypothetical protein